MIKFRFTDCEEQDEMPKGTVKAFANDAPIGFLVPDGDLLGWVPDTDDPGIIRFQWRNFDTFNEVVKRLGSYSIEHGKWLTMQYKGFAEYLPTSYLLKTGFLHQGFKGIKAAEDSLINAIAPQLAKKARADLLAGEETDVKCPRCGEHPVRSTTSKGERTIISCRCGYIYDMQINQ